MTERPSIVELRDQVLKFVPEADSINTTILLAWLGELAQNPLMKADLVRLAAVGEKKYSDATVERYVTVLLAGGVLSRPAWGKYALADDIWVKFPRLRDESGTKILEGVPVSFLIETPSMVEADVKENLLAMFRSEAERWDRGRYRIEHLAEFDWLPSWMHDVRMQYMRDCMWYAYKWADLPLDSPARKRIPNALITELEGHPDAMLRFIRYLMMCLIVLNKPGLIKEIIEVFRITDHFGEFRDDESYDPRTNTYNEVKSRDLEDGCEEGIARMNWLRDWDETWLVPKDSMKWLPRED